MAAKRLTPLSTLTRDPRMLKQHPVNIVIYGEDLPAPLEDSIRQYGIREPLLVCKSDDPELDNVIVSGRRRRNIAIKLGIKDVPIIEWACEDKLIFEQQLLLLNVRADLTVEQKTRVYNRLQEIDQQLRSEQGNVVPRGLKDVEPAASQASKEKAAKQVGMSRRTADRATTAVAAADKLAEEGKPEAAKEILHELNNGSVNGAAKKAEEILAKTDDAVNAESQAISKEIGKLKKAIAATAEATKSLMRALDEKSSKSKAFKQRFRKFESRMTTLHESMENPQKIVEMLDQDWMRTLKELGNE